MHERRFCQPVALRRIWACMTCLVSATTWALCWPATIRAVPGRLTSPSIALAAYSAHLDGVNVLMSTADIVKNAVATCRRVCPEAARIGVPLNHAANEVGEPCITRLTVRSPRGDPDQRRPDDSQAHLGPGQLMNADPRSRQSMIGQLRQRLSQLMKVSEADIVAWNRRCSARVQQRHERVRQLIQRISRWREPR